MAGKVGQPTKCTPKRMAAIIAAIENGKSEGTAARENGVHPDTLSEWKAKKPEIADAIADARDVFDEHLLARVRNIADDFENKQTLGAATWLLERRNPKLYGRSTTVRGDPENPIAVADADRTLARRLDEMPLAELRGLALSIAGAVDGKKGK